ncbi:dna polymerase iii alpha subunit [hydrocarbon metagenome]|uniref:Dna polymerase iii alpha subunit n=1 Tax=hydrocarbon metagenome TaxID=938273 RepID=A0A0W8E154_9ZZZZ
MIKHYPAEYYTAILNNQPMGFYPPYIICGEARRRGISLLPPDVNASRSDFQAKNKSAIRVGLKQIRGMSSEALLLIAAERSRGVFNSPLEFMERSGVNRDIMENLIKCGALDTLQENRRQMLMEVPAWMEYIKKKKSREQELFKSYKSGEVTDFDPREKEALEREILGFDIRSHFMAELRGELSKRNIYSSTEVKKLPGGKQVQAAGLLFRPHRPPTRSGKIVVFFSLTDEFGLIEVSVFEPVYMRYGDFIFGEQKAPLLVKGRISRRGNGVSIMAQEISFLPM